MRATRGCDLGSHQSLASIVDSARSFRERNVLREDAPNRRDELVSGHRDQQRGEGRVVCPVLLRNQQRLAVTQPPRLEQARSEQLVRLHVDGLSLR